MITEASQQYLVEQGHITTTAQVALSWHCLSQPGQGGWGSWCWAPACQDTQPGCSGSRETLQGTEPELHAALWLSVCRTNSSVQLYYPGNHTTLYCMVSSMFNQENQRWPHPLPFSNNKVMFRSSCKLVSVSMNSQWWLLLSLEPPLTTLLVTTLFLHWHKQLSCLASLQKYQWNNTETMLDFCTSSFLWAKKKKKSQGILLKDSKAHCSNLWSTGKIKSDKGFYSSCSRV